MRRSVSHGSCVAAAGLAALALSVLTSCGDDDGAVAPDAGGSGDGSPGLDGDTRDGEITEDSAPRDAGPEALPDVQVECPPPPGGVEPAAGRWSLSLFHFNVQYVAGGTERFAEIALGNPRQARLTDFSEEEVEDRIVTESVAPVLEILERNPDFALTFELQGYMVDVLRARHPETLSRMRALVNGGQLELASIHWSDQMFLTWGRRDLDESERRTRESFAAAELPLSRVVFAQEGQFGEGFAAWLAERRPEAVAVLARNLQGFYQRDLVDRAAWRMRGTDVVLPRGLQDETVDRQWSFFDDGELLATADANPYLGVAFARVETAVRTYEAQLRCAASRGYRVGRVADYLDAVAESGFEPTELPPILDGTWQPGSTRGPLRWHGGAGDLWARHERDNEVLTTCARARQTVLALDTLVGALGAMATDAQRGALDTAWRELLLGQVSDARGVNPWWGEREYGLAHCTLAGEAADALVRAEAAARPGQHLVADTREGTAEWTATPPPPPSYTDVAAPADIAVTVGEDGGRDASIVWRRLEVPAGEAERFRVEVRWSEVPAAVEVLSSCLAAGGTEPSCSVQATPISVRFPREAGFVGYRPALLGEPVRYTDDDFSYDPRALEQGVWTVAGDGYVELGSGWYLVKDTTTVGLAVGFPPGADHVELRDETLPDAEPAVWSFWLTRDQATALELADRNLAPRVVAP